MIYTMGQYQIKTMDDEVIISDTFQNVIFWIIGTLKPALYRLVNQNADPVDVVIPRQFPLGHHIDFLRPNFVHGEFGKITISNGIKVDELAFANSDIEEVVWPDDECTIPPQCFENSKIKKISNIENVEEIGEEAFFCAPLQSLNLSNTNISHLNKGSLSGLFKECNITLPYYVSQEEFEESMKIYSFE